jgi:hypothetical protein
MRCYITGSVSPGGSTVVRVVDTDPTGITSLWPIEDEPTDVPPAPQAAPRELDVPHGGSRWLTAYFPPGSGLPVNSTREPSMHWTKSIDFDLVLSGQMELILETTSVTLEAGDAAVITGVQHAWKAGPEGCLMLALLLDSIG